MSVSWVVKDRSWGRRVPGGGEYVCVGVVIASQVVQGQSHILILTLMSRDFGLAVRLTMPIKHGEKAFIVHKQYKKAFLRANIT